MRVCWVVVVVGVEHIGSGSYLPGASLAVGWRGLGLRALPWLGWYHSARCTKCGESDARCLYFSPVQGVCSESASFDLPAGLIAGAIEEAGTAAELALNLADGSSHVPDEGGHVGKHAAGVVNTLTFPLSVGMLCLIWRHPS